MQRRKFIFNISAAAVAGSTRIEKGLYEPFPLYRKDVRSSDILPLKVKPVLIYNLFEKVEAETWREWGGLKTFIQNPHDGIATCAHCSSPRRMNGRDLEPADILTHCESDYGAAPKVFFRKDQIITNIVPDYHSIKWVGFKGKIIDHPSYDICRSQFD